MKVWHEIHYAYQYAKTYSHREVDDGESDAEENAHGKCHKALSADIAVHGLLDISSHILPERSYALRKDLDPVGCEVFVVKKDEEHIEQCHETDAKADDDVVCLADDYP